MESPDALPRLMEHTSYIIDQTAKKFACNKRIIKIKDKLYTTFINMAKEYHDKGTLLAAQPGTAQLPALRPNLRPHDLRLSLDDMNKRQRNEREGEIIVPDLYHVVDFYFHSDGSINYGKSHTSCPDFQIPAFYPTTTSQSHPLQKLPKLQKSESPFGDTYLNSIKSPSIPLFNKLFPNGIVPPHLTTIQAYPLVDYDSEDDRLPSVSTILTPAEHRAILHARVDASRSFGLMPNNPTASGGSAGQPNRNPNPTPPSPSPTQPNPPTPPNQSNQPTQPNQPNQPTQPSQPQPPPTTNHAPNLKV